jgi:hypothetical protein
VFDNSYRRVAIALATIAAGGLLAACGSASSSSSTSSSSGTTASASAAGSGGSTTGSARRAQLVACLKSHGVTLPARPAGSGPPPGGAGSSGGSSGGAGTGTGTSTTPRRGFFFGGGPGGAKITPKMRAAFQACGARFGFGGGRGFRGRISHTAITSFVTCVKQHGYNLPAPNFSGKGPIFPQKIESNAKFQAAAKSCQHLLIPARPNGSGSGSGSGGTSTTSGA